MGEQLFTTEQVAELLAVSKSTVRKWKSNEELPFVKLGALIRFRASDVEAFVASKTQVPDAS